VSGEWNYPEVASSEDVGGRPSEVGLLRSKCGKRPDARREETPEKPVKMHIYKYQLLDISNLQSHRIDVPRCFQATVELPVCSARLKIDKQGPSQICLWAMVNPEETKKELRDYLFVMTGGPAPAGAKYMNTLLFDDGAFVLHVFEAIQ
jgi:hypothetical protein